MSTAEGLRRENAMTFQPPREHEVVEIATSGRGRGDAGIGGQHGCREQATSVPFWSRMMDSAF